MYHAQRKSNQGGHAVVAIAFYLVLDLYGGVKCFITIIAVAYVGGNGG